MHAAVFSIIFACLMFASPASAECKQSGDPDCTCTAPGHDDCTITCKPGQGCVALYDESGECGDHCCSTTCTGEGKSARATPRMNASFVAKGANRGAIERAIARLKNKN